MKQHPRGAAAFLLTLVAIWFVGCVVSKNPVTGRKRAYGYSWEQEKQIGAEADGQIIQQFGLYDDGELASYVDRIGQEVLLESHVRRPDADPAFRSTEFYFRVLDSPVINAFALPGGYIYVTRGLLSHLENEAQLAVVLGHEIGHVEARHASQRAFEQQAGQLFLIGGAIAGQELLGLPAQDLLNLGGTAAQLLFLKYGRDDERESDRLGVEYAAMAGYQASEGAEFFRTLRRISEREGAAIPGFMSTHPDPGEREESIVSLADDWREKLSSPMDRVGRRPLYNAIDGIVVGENPREGFVEAGTFYHPELAFQFRVPNGFKLINQRQQVIMLAEDQGGILGLTLSQEGSARAAAAKLAQQQGIRVIDSGTTSTNGLPAAYVFADAQTQDGQVVRLLSYYLEYGGNVYNFLGYAAQQNFSRYENSFQTTIGSFAQLNDQRILAVQPARLRAISASSTAPFRAFVPDQSDLPPDFTAEELAILNQVTLEQTIESGSLLKTTRR